MNMGMHEKDMEKEALKKESVEQRIKRNQCTRTC